MQNLLELQCLVDDLVDFLIDFFRIINVYHCFFALITIFDEIDRGPSHKKHFD